MRLRAVLVVALLLLPALGLAQTKKKKPSVPAIFGTAKYVFVRAEDGDIYNPNLLPEDRDAISDVLNALRAWGRYTLMPTVDGAELVMIVRKGRLGSMQMSGTVAGPGPGPTRGTSGSTGAPGVGLGGEAGPPDDFLEVRMRNQDGELSGPIWERTMTDGLNGPNVPMLQVLKDAVDHDYPQK